MTVPPGATERHSPLSSIDRRGGALTRLAHGVRDARDACVPGFLPSLGAPHSMDSPLDPSAAVQIILPPAAPVVLEGAGAERRNAGTLERWNAGTLERPARPRPFANAETKFEFKLGFAPRGSVPKRPSAQAPKRRATLTLRERAKQV